MKTVSTWISMCCLWREDSFTVNTFTESYFLCQFAVCRSVKIYCSFLSYKMDFIVCVLCIYLFFLAIIGPPIIFLSGCGHCLNISISLPSESRKVDQLHPFYNSVSFNISWKKAGQNEVSIPVKGVFCICSNRIR